MQSWIQTGLYWTKGEICEVFCEGKTFKIVKNEVKSDKDDSEYTALHFLPRITWVDGCPSD